MNRRIQQETKPNNRNRPVQQWEQEKQQQPCPSSGIVELSVKQMVHTLFVTGTAVNLAPIIQVFTFEPAVCLHYHNWIIYKLQRGYCTYPTLSSLRSEKNILIQCKEAVTCCMSAVLMTPLPEQRWQMLAQSRTCTSVMMFYFTLV